MIHRGRMKLFLISSLVIVITFVTFSSSRVTGQIKPFWDVQKKLAEITEEEREILQYLFVLAQEIEEMEREEGEITQELGRINQEIKSLEVMIKDEEINYEKKQEILKKTLKSYQRMGPGTYLEILLDSENLSMLLRRLNTLRDLTRNTGELLESLEESKEKLTIEKRKLSEKLVLMDSKQKELRVSLDKKLQLIGDKEEYLISLEEERAFYQEHLTNIQQMWGELKPLFTETTKEFSRIIEKGNLPPDVLKTSFDFFSISSSIDEKILNDIIAGHSNLPEMIFRFYPGRVEMSLTEQNLILAGTFVILEGHTLKFQVEEGSFYGIPLETKGIEELFQEGYMVLNLKPLVGRNTLRSIKILEGQLELTATLNLF